jgi:hypothetical protein
VRKSRYVSAVADFTTAIGADETCVDAFKRRGALHLMKGRREAACEDWERACELGSCAELNKARSEGYCNGLQGPAQGPKEVE